MGGELFELCDGQSGPSDDCPSDCAGHAESGGGTGSCVDPVGCDWPKCLTVCSAVSYQCLSGGWRPEYGWLFLCDEHKEQWSRAWIPFVPDWFVALAESDLGEEETDITIRNTFKVLHRTLSETPRVFLVPGEAGTFTLKMPTKVRAWTVDINQIAANWEFYVYSTGIHRGWRTRRKKPKPEKPKLDYDFSDLFPDLPKEQPFFLPQRRVVSGKYR